MSIQAVCDYIDARVENLKFKVEHQFHWTAEERKFLEKILEEYKFLQRLYYIEPISQEKRA